MSISKKKTKGAGSCLLAVSKRRLSIVLFIDDIQAPQTKLDHKCMKYICKSEWLLQIIGNYEGGETLESSNNNSIN